jgi:hypothetical protein
MLDSMWAYQFQVQPKLSLEDGRMPLPCQELLWEAKTALQWHHVFQFSACEFRFRTRGDPLIN